MPEIPTHLIALPAYGRDYATEEEVIADWEDHKDFQLEMPLFPHIDRRYINKGDKPSNSRLNIRYARATKVLVINFDGTPMTETDDDGRYLD